MCHNEYFSKIMFHLCPCEYSPTKDFVTCELCNEMRLKILKYISQLPKRTKNIKKRKEKKKLMR